MPNLPDFAMTTIFKLATASKAVKLLVVAGWVGFGNLASGASAFDLGRLNALLNLALLAVVFVAAFPLVKSKRKDQTIQEQENLLKAKDARIVELRDDLDDARQNVRQIEQGAAHVREQLVAAEAKYEEQGKYTAEKALTAVMQTMRQGEGNHERRHVEVMEALAALKLALERK